MLQKKSKSLPRSPKYYLNSDNEFVIENYNNAKPFSSFLPAIAGLYGKPMWVFYVNRGQCISSIGLNNKDYSIMEFQPANKAYRLTSSEGFRTFLKVRDAVTGSTNAYEPFQDYMLNKDYKLSQKMYITSYDFKLEEINETLGIKVEVMYCTLPGEKLGGLVRSLRITNISESCKEIDVLDGLPVIIPYYLINQDMKNESNLRQAWMGVENSDTIPFYKIKVLPYDTAETQLIEGGNFYLNFSFDRNELCFSKTIIDPSVIFGHVTDFSYPENYWMEDFFIPQKQVSVGITPCGFGYKNIKLEAKEQQKTYTLIGSSENYELLTDFVTSKLNESYIVSKIDENKTLVESLKNNVFTMSSSREFDLYCGQSFMDNFLRGGYPISVGKGKHTFYVYSRKHGDLEREYNFFQVDSTYFSQGNSNFRDVNQNRRSDVSIFPFIEDTNIKTFFNLLQLDGFNPLVLIGSRFAVEDVAELDAILIEFLNDENTAKVREFLCKPFAPGALLGFLENTGIHLKKGTLPEFLDSVLSISQKEDLADFKEGFWVDHWLYNIDLLEQYVSIFPDKVIDLLFNDCQYTYYDNSEVVAPRRRKYVLASNGVRQIGSVVKNGEKEEMIRARRSSPNMVRTEYGKGGIYKCTLISKIITLIVNKIASLDPEGTGIEMESNKPGWCDALNGLPTILGSSINESAALKRLALLLLNILNKNEANKIIDLPKEVYTFFIKISELLSDNMDAYQYWNLSYSLKENYREETLFGLSGREVSIDTETLVRFLNNVVLKIDRGLEKAFNREDGVYYTYFINEVVEYLVIKDENGIQMKNKNGYPYVQPLKFKQRPIPYFLEGPVHIMKMEEDADKARQLYNAVRKTGLYDEKLGMYLVNVNIMDETKEIGRQNIFPRGWLENEAVFLHMEYKYFLGLLKCGLYEEFFECFKKALIPFLDPKVYGRSILENSSFIASSVYPDEKVHGTGFVSRLTGASAELLNIWLYMTAGQKPFFIDTKGELCLEFKPVLQGWLFNEKAKELVICNKSGTYEKVSFEANTFAFNFLGNILTVYHNESMKDTFGEKLACIKEIKLQKGNEVIIINNSVIPSPYAGLIREGSIDRIDVYMK